jgi:hypothetical protein
LKSSPVIFCFLLAIQLAASIAFGQPWNNPLMIAHSTDGVTFAPAEVFQDSGGVPCALKWRGDTLMCVFQWCREPIGSPTWDRVAAKFSYDNGLTWTDPEVIQFDDLPPSYQRPFDPTIVVTSGDSIRVYFSSSDGQPPPGADSLVNTYSAISADGLHFRFEPGPRVDDPASRVIDPAVVHFSGLWHYLSPIGAPQSGAYHYVSPDGLDYTRVPDIASDPVHNWTGNFTAIADSALRFYGCGGQSIWFNSSANGGVWTGYTATNQQGGDPTVVRISHSSYLMIFVGPPYLPVTHSVIEPKSIALYPNFPNPFNSATEIRFDIERSGTVSLIIYDLLGREVAALAQRSFVPGSYSLFWNAADCPSGTYLYRLIAPGFAQTRAMVLLK